VGREEEEDRRRKIYKNINVLTNYTFQSKIARLFF